MEVCMSKRFNASRWLNWAILAFIYLIVFFHRMSVGAIHTQLEEEFALNSASLAAFGSIYFYVYMIMQIPAGILADTLGARKTITLGAIIAGAGSVLFGLAPSLSVAYAGRFLVGLGVSVVFIPILSVNSRWFRPREFATITGLTAFVGNMGSILAQTPLVLLAALFSWRATFIAIGVMGALAGVLCYILVRNRPEDAGFPAVAPEAKKEHPHFGHACAAVLKNPRSWPLFVFLFCLYGTHVTFAGTFGLQYLSETFGMGDVTAGNYTLILLLALACSALLFGFISDRIGRRKPPLIISGVLNAFVLSMLVLFGDRLGSAALTVLMILLGIAGSIPPMCLTLSKEINPPAYIGISTSITNMAAFVGSAIVPVIVGALLDHFRPFYSGAALYARGFIPLIIAAVMALAMLPFIRETGCSNIYEKK